MNYHLQAQDGTIGKVSDFYFDGHTWQLRYCVASVGDWLARKHVLLAPESLKKPVEEVIPVDLTKEQIRNSPESDLDKPISRRHEEEIRYYYGWPVYWQAPPYIGPGPLPVEPAAAELMSNNSSTSERKPVESESTLRSAKEVIGYGINAMDKDIGHVHDFIVDTDSWIIRYAVVDTGTWIPGKKVLIAPAWIEGISWSTQKITTSVTPESIEKSPEFDASAPVNREYEEILYDYYGRPRYWVR